MIYHGLFGSGLFQRLYAAPPAALFPLLCPVREYDWIDDAADYRGTCLANYRLRAKPLLRNGYAKSLSRKDIVQPFGAPV